MLIKKGIKKQFNGEVKRKLYQPELLSSPENYFPDKVNGFA